MKSIKVKNFKVIDFINDYYSISNHWLNPRSNYDSLLIRVCQLLSESLRELFPVDYPFHQEELLSLSRNNPFSIRASQKEGNTTLFSEIVVRANTAVRYQLIADVKTTDQVNKKANASS